MSNCEHILPTYDILDELAKDFLTAKGTECSLRDLADHKDGVHCYMDVGYIFT